LPRLFSSSVYRYGPYKGRRTAHGTQPAGPDVSRVGIKRVMLIGYSLDNHTGSVNVVRYNHGAKYILTGSSDRSVRLWNAAAGKEIKVYQGHAHEILALDV
jgi:WD40 repeat protein